MAKYTLELRQYIESGGVVFDFDYPIFDSAYKTTLENNIIDYYYFREIGLETIAQFKQFLKAKMNLIMPYYNQMYNSQKEFLTKDLFFNKNLTDTYTKTTTSDTTNTTSTTSNNTTTNDGDTTDTEKYYDSPQTQLNTDNGEYLTNETVTEHTGSTNVTENGTGNATETGNGTVSESYTLTSAGDDGMRYPASVWNEIKESFVNIDMQIIDDLRGLFMNVY